MDDDLSLRSNDRFHRPNLDSNVQDEDNYHVSQENFELLALTISSVLFYFLKGLIIVIPLEILSNETTKIYELVLILVLSDFFAITGAFLANNIILLIAAALTLFNFVVKMITFFYVLIDDRSKVFDSFMNFYILDSIVCGISLIFEIVEILLLASLIYTIKRLDKITIKIHRSLIKKLFLGK